MASSSRARKNKYKQPMQEQPTFDERRFKSENHEHIFNWMMSRDIVPEVLFKLKDEEYPDIHKVIRKRGWELLCDQPQVVSMLLIHEFYANVIMKDDEEEPYLSYVRGVVVPVSPDTINRVLKTKPKRFKQPSYEERVKYDPRCVDVLSDLCKVGMDWVLDSHKQPLKLRRGDLIPQAKGWHDIVRRSLISTSNNSEVTLNRAIMIHCIMKGGKIDVGETIAKNIINIAEDVQKDSWLGYPSTILRLCEEAGVPLKEFDSTDIVSTGKPITKKLMEYVTTIQLERQPLARRKRRKEARQEEEQEEGEEQGEGEQQEDREEPAALGMNQLQAALEGISGQYSQIQRSQNEQAQQQRDLWQLMDRQRGAQAQWMDQQREYQTHMMELQQEQYTKMYEAINNSTAEYERSMNKVIKEQAQLRKEQAQQRELFHKMDNREDMLYREFNENRMFKEARHTDRIEYDMCTQEKLSYICGTLPVLNPKIQTFNEAHKVLEEQETSRVKFNIERLKDRMVSSGIWRKVEEGSTTKQQGEIRSKRREDPKGKGKQGESSKGKEPKA
ncbi:uncharacterized protein LOC127744925 [Arachis duranensis]|uniref:Uncharacterized protein LOC127744925 n=1 Tax=Arachis duranensis TaxID=130453 RepID=A0A9C6WL40_ARADU|nr:uncharacterized protein LOC127744925 [Arachis duranensis]